MSGYQLKSLSFLSIIVCEKVLNQLLLFGENIQYNCFAIHFAANQRIHQQISKQTYVHHLIGLIQIHDVLRLSSLISNLITSPLSWMGKNSRH